MLIENQAAMETEGVYSFGIVLGRGRRGAGGEEQHLQMRHFSETLDLPSVGTCLLLTVAKCRRGGFVSLLAVFPALGTSLLSVCPCVDVAHGPSCPQRLLCSTRMGSGGDQELQRHQASFFRHQVGDLQLSEPPWSL